MNLSTLLFPVPTAADAAQKAAHSLDANSRMARINALTELAQRGLLDSAQIDELKKLVNNEIKQLSGQEEIKPYGEGTRGCAFVLLCFILAAGALMLFGRLASCSQASAQTAGIDNPAPRAELVNAYPRHHH
jgi:hypothetical protein